MTNVALVALACGLIIGLGALGAGSRQEVAMSGRAERFEWLLALRFLREGRLQTLFILVGIAIGVGVIVFKIGRAHV